VFDGVYKAVEGCGDVEASVDGELRCNAGFDVARCTGDSEAGCDCSGGAAGAFGAFAIL